MCTDNEPKNNLHCALLYWSEFGDEPHLSLDAETFKRRHYTLQDFIKDIDVPILHNGQLYRYIVTTISYKIGDIINFDVPTSWSSNKQTVLDMSFGLQNAKILIIKSNNLRGKFNIFNQYGENEFIIIPLTMHVTKIDDNFIYVCV